MEELKALLKKSLEDENSAENEYSRLIEVITNTKELSDELKVLSITLVEKIRIDEETHNEMLNMLNEVIIQL